ncbi:hypothetical protein GSI_09548 [Ganoderma sinense ZZ0214-1]|uniref:Golgi apparatus membrane protein TVP38 n=1 Tax=Ganoderma sinense ZZ0214-1 TaxID=1077348 RepID=A0A2G8S3U3_9APHY|nr:hypothetical protein GSI_09548 [Ganoderma sinense ZZ0214-1]
MATSMRRTTSIERPPTRSPVQVAVKDTHRYPPNRGPSLAVISSDSQSPEDIFVNLQGNSRTRRDSESQKDVVAPVDRQLVRTPDPTPSEQFLLTHKARECNWTKVLDWRRYRNPRVFWPIAVTVTLVLILILFIAFKNQLVDKMRPFADWMHDTPGGWAIPIALLIVMSFPPLFGHEIVAILCGVVWGIWLGFGIVAAGTALGELANFYVYKWWCGARGRKLEESKLNWALLAEVVRQGGLRMPLLMRLTYIPSHFLTAVFSTCGMNLWVFTASAVLSLPKQLAVVFIGVSGANGQDLPTSTKAIKYSVIGAAVLLTFVAMWYIYGRMDGVKGQVIYARRKRRQAKLLAAAGYPPELAYGPGPEERAGEATPLGGAMADAHLQEVGVELETRSRSRSQEGRPPRPRRTPPPPRPNSVMVRDPVAARSGSPGVVWHYPKPSIDSEDEGPRSPFVSLPLPLSSDVHSGLGAHAQSGGAAGRGGMNTSTTRSATVRKPWFAFKLVGPRRAWRLKGEVKTAV